MNKNLIIVLVFLLAVIGAIYFLVYGGQFGSNTTYQQTPSNQSGVSQQNTPSDTVTIKNFSFSPATLTVTKGSTVTWINQDNVEHQIKLQGFESAPLAQGAAFSHTFDQTGTYDYICAIHTAMTGTIIVK